MLTFWAGAGGLGLTVPVASAQSERMEYDITWIGVSVGTMRVQSETLEDGSVLRSIRVWNRPWIAKVYPVDNTIECRIEATTEGPRHTLTKQMSERNFTQDDVLVLWPETGRAVWSNAVSNVVHSFEVPPGTRDYVSFFFDLRDAAANQSWAVDGDYQLVMDGDVHALELQVGESTRIRTPLGRRDAIPVKAISRSPTLFSRNQPRSVWVCPVRPVVLSADVVTRFGAVRGTLSHWEIDGQPIDLEPSE